MHCTMCLLVALCLWVYYSVLGWTEQPRLRHAHGGHARQWHVRWSNSADGTIANLLYHHLPLTHPLLSLTASLTSSQTKFPNFISLSPAILLLHPHTHPPLQLNLPVFTRDSIYAIARICYRPSVHLSVRLSVTRVDHTKTVEDRIMKLAPSGSPMILVFWRQMSSPNSKGFPRTGASKKGGVGKFSDFLALSVNLENGSRYGQSYY